MDGEQNLHAFTRSHLARSCVPTGAHFLKGRNLGGSPAVKRVSLQLTIPGVDCPG